MLSSDGESGSDGGSQSPPQTPSRRRRRRLSRASTAASVLSPSASPERRSTAVIKQVMVKSKPDTDGAPKKNLVAWQGELVTLEAIAQAEGLLSAERRIWVRNLVVATLALFMADVMAVAWLISEIIFFISQGLAANLTISFMFLSALMQLLALRGLLRTSNSAPTSKSGEGCLTAFLVLQTPLSVFGLLSSAFLIEVDARTGASCAILSFVKLVSVYFVRLLLKFNKELRAMAAYRNACRWAKTSRSQQIAALKIQTTYRSHRARQMIVRLSEFTAWEERRWGRRVVGLVTYTMALGAVAGLTYVNLVFAILFDKATRSGWLLTCFIAFIVEGIVQQPVVLMVSAVLGDFVEQFAGVLGDVSDGLDML